jgi:hypothetical protein
MQGHPLEEKMSGQAFQDCLEPMKNPELAFFQTNFAGFTAFFIAFTFG